MQPRFAEPQDDAGRERLPAPAQRVGSECSVGRRRRCRPVGPTSAARRTAAAAAGTPPPRTPARPAASASARVRSAAAGSAVYPASGDPSAPKTRSSRSADPDDQQPATARAAGARRPRRPASTSALSPSVTSTHVRCAAPRVKNPSRASDVSASKLVAFVLTCCGGGDSIVHRAGEPSPERLLVERREQIRKDPGRSARETAGTVGTASRSRMTAERARARRVGAGGLPAAAIERETSTTKKTWDSVRARWRSVLRQAG